jgi:hypothetical protein
VAQENNGGLIFLGILAALAALGLAVLALAYAGLSVIIGIDYVARAFTWLGIGTPTWAWMGLGCLGGAFVGLAMGLRRAQRSPGLPVYGGAGLVVCLIFLGAYFSEPIKSNESIPPPVTVTPRKTCPAGSRAGSVANALNVNLRSLDNPNAATLATLPEGTRVCIQEWRGKWVRVFVLEWASPKPVNVDGGWINSNFVRQD